MLDKSLPIALVATEVAPREKKSLYPEPFAARMEGRLKRVLGDQFGLSNFGVNLTTLAPNGASALRHSHATQDEFIYVIQGNPTLVTDQGKTLLSAGMCAGFKAGTGNGHCLVNESSELVLYLEVGDRSAGDEVSYPDEDLKAVYLDQSWQFLHKDGSPY
ncbi:MAG: cupin domain-containing protein [Undibacterium sp.]|nr:cupin domain-containing protein [Undibacterium sp.]